MTAIPHTEMNGKHVLFSRKSQTPRKVRGKKLTQDQVVLNYLLTGNPLSDSAALKLFGCKNVSAPICRLRKKGWVIQTQKRGGTDGEAIYWMTVPGNESRRDTAMPLFSTQEKPQEKPQEAVQQPAEPEKQPAKASANEARTVTIRAGQDGPEIQVIPAGSVDGEFVKLTPTQTRYLLTTLGVFA